MLCRKCGKFVDDGANFCPRCGQAMTAFDAAQPTQADPEPEVEIDVYNEAAELPVETVELSQPQQTESDSAPEEAITEPEATVETVDAEESVEAEESEPIYPEPEAAPKPKYKRWPSILVLALIFVFGFVVFLVDQSSRIPVQDASMPWFTLQDGVLYFDESLYTGGNELTVPESINGQTVTAISEDCFYGCERIIMIYLPETITSIGKHAFANCTALRGIRLPETLVSLGDEAFANCYALESVCIPYSLAEFGRRPFFNCRSLKYFFYPAPVSYWRQLPIEGIPENSFVYCADGIYLAK